eukprot:4556475-Prymnesium_polylepis.1
MAPRPTRLALTAAGVMIGRRRHLGAPDRIGTWASEAQAPQSDSPRAAGCKWGSAHASSAVARS